jgi:NAD(P)-dependent dehydrogenase (short-subunit alcohol dehydrogenase family)
MKRFKDRVAVVTGAASGIGKGIADRCAQEGMNIVLADIEGTALAKAESDLKATGADVVAVVTDVSKADQVEALAQRTLDAFGAVHLLCNNAGVGAGSTVWESSIKDWEWVLGVNLWGTVHGLRAFVPIMLEQDTESHIVNTSSIAGLMSLHRSAAYHASKHAIVALTEKLHYDLAERGGKVKVSVLCPGWVKTRIMDAERNRPAELEDDAEESIVTPEMEAMMEEYRQACDNGMSPDKVADFVFQAIRDEKIYILPNAEFGPFVKERMETVLQAFGDGLGTKC